MGYYDGGFAGFSMPAGWKAFSKGCLLDGGFARFYVHCGFVCHGGDLGSPLYVIPPYLDLYFD